MQKKIAIGCTFEMLYDGAVRPIDGSAAALAICTIPSHLDRREPGSTTSDVINVPLKSINHVR